jgi:hypothetical protein
VDFHDGIFSAPVAGKRNLLKIRRLTKSIFQLHTTMLAYSSNAKKRPARCEIR